MSRKDGVLLNTAFDLRNPLIVPFVHALALWAVLVVWQGERHPLLLVSDGAHTWVSPRLRFGGGTKDLGRRWA